MSFNNQSRYALLVATAVFAGGALVTSGSVSHAQDKTVTVGGAAMSSSKTIVENAANSKDHTTLVTAVKAAGLAETLSGKGPFTVFAPTNAAFEKLPKGTVETLVKPENKTSLSGILTYHVVPGSLSGADLAQQVKNGGGKAMLKTVAGGQLTVMDAGGGKLSVSDAKGGKSMVTIADVNQSNGVIHVVDTVLMPAS
ncbi:MAG TPA: fasciclin domain-containing protein [Microvirga sp.]